MENLLKSLSKTLAAFACVVLIAVMLITFVDVVGRYFFNAPITFAVELIQLGMGLLVLFGLAITTLQRGHIAVDVIESLVPEGVAGLFITRFAPADYLDTVNTLGLPYYADSQPKGRKGVKLEVQSNPLHLCLVPGAIIELKL